MTPTQFERLQKVVRDHDIAGKTSPLVMVDCNDLRALISQFTALAASVPPPSAPDPEAEAEAKTPWWADL